MNANWEPPVNINRLSADACHTDNPATTASAPNEMPYSPVASPTDSPRFCAGLNRITRTAR